MRGNQNPSADETAAVLSALTERWQTLPELASAAHVPPRTTQAAVNRLRRLGAAIIASGPHGYRLASNVAEGRRTVASLRRRSETIAETADALERLVARVWG